MLPDAALLRRYVEEHDEPAFAELVRRHLDVVYAAALRRLGGRAHLAEEVAQKVFSDLSRKAAGLVHHPALVGWLHRSTRFAAIDAQRAEGRREKLAQSLATMPDVTSQSDPSVDWAQLRPLLDDALDQIKEQDRALMLLRYFHGFTFAEAGARLSLSEDAARRRSERALDQLRAHLGKRGYTSTTAALGVLLASQPAIAAPAGLAASVTTAAVAVAPAGGALATFLFMSKITTPALSAALAAGVTALVWTAVVPGISAEELATLRADNARLAQATAADAPTESVAAVADEYATTVTGIARAMAERQAARKASITAAATTPSSSGAPEVTPRGHWNRGIATARDASLTFAWASDICDPDELAKVITFDPDGREKALAILATMPDAIRTQYPTPEAFYGLVLAATCLEAPPPGADLIERFMVEVELRPGRTAMRRKGSDHNNHEYQLTDEGWKYVIPEVGVTHMPRNLNSKTLAKLATR